MLASVFLAWLALRFVGAFVDRAWRDRGDDPPDHELPVYTVIAALYREAASVDGLLAAIARLDYPGIMAQTPQNRRPPMISRQPLSTIVLVVSLLPSDGEARGMAAKKDKTLSYRRAIWLNENPASISLASCIKQATAKLTGIDDRTIPRDGGQLMKLLKMKADRQGGFSLHISIETPGESASIVPTKHGVPDVDVSTIKPPPNAEFMDGDAFLYVRDDDVCLCSTIIRDGAITYYLRELFQKADFRKDSTMFDLIKVADIDKVKLLKAQGVKEIHIRSALFEASASFHQRKGQTLGILGAAAKQLKAVLGKEHDVTSDALQVAMTIKTDERRKGMKLGEPPAHLTGAMPSSDHAIELQNLRLQHPQLSAKSGNTGPCYFGQALVTCIRDDTEQLIDTPAPDRRDDAKLGKMRSDRIDNRGLLANKQMSGAMKRQAALLLRRLGLHESHVRSADSLADGLRVSSVVLLPLHVGLHIGWRHQPDRVTECLQFTRPVMRRGACLDAN